MSHLLFAKLSGTFSDDEILGGVRAAASLCTYRPAKWSVKEIESHRTTGIIFGRYGPRLASRFNRYLQPTSCLGIDFVVMLGVNIFTDCLSFTRPLSIVIADNCNASIRDTD